MTTPIYSAIPIVRLAVDAALGPLVLIQQGGSGATRLYWQRQVLNVYPCVIHQSQDAGGAGDHRLGNAGWSGLWTIRALATDPTTAETWIEAVRVGMDSLSIPAPYTGYTIQAIHERPIVVPPDENIHQAAHVYRVRVYRST